MPALEELIEYWKERLLPHPPITTREWMQTVRKTIAYLEELEKLKKGEQIGRRASNLRGNK